MHGMDAETKHTEVIDKWDVCERDIEGAIQRVTEKEQSDLV